MVKCPPLHQPYYFSLQPQLVRTTSAPAITLVNSPFLSERAFLSVYVPPRI